MKNFLIEVLIVVARRGIRICCVPPTRHRLSNRQLLFCTNVRGPDYFTKKSTSIMIHHSWDQRRRWKKLRTSVPRLSGSGLASRHQIDPASRISVYNSMKKADEGLELLMKHKSKTLTIEIQGRPR